MHHLTTGWISSIVCDFYYILLRISYEAPPSWSIDFLLCLIHRLVTEILEVGFCHERLWLNKCSFTFDYLCIFLPCTNGEISREDDKFVVTGNSYLELLDIVACEVHISSGCERISLVSDEDTQQFGLSRDSLCRDKSLKEWISLFVLLPHFDTGRSTVVVQVP